MKKPLKICLVIVTLIAVFLIYPLFELLYINPTRAVHQLNQGSNGYLNLSYSTLRNMNLDGRKLEHMMFHGSLISKVSLDGTTLRKCDFRPVSDALYCRGIRSTTIQDCDFTTARLSGSDMRGCRIKRCRFSAQSLDGVMLGNAEVLAPLGNTIVCAAISDSHFTKVDFRGQSVVFIGCSLRGCKLDNMQHSGFTKCDLTDASLKGTNMTLSDLPSCKLANAVYDAKTNWPRGFDPIKAGAVLVK